MDIESKTLVLILLLNITVSGMQHVKVSCQNQKICALQESSVNLTCSFPNINITTGFWFSLKDKAKWINKEHPEDLALDSDYAGRVSDIKLTNFSSTLTITDLRKRDSGEYHVMFITDKGERYRSSDGVTLTVTDLQVSQDSTNKVLVCSTSCRLTFASFLFHWYKNGQYLNMYTKNTDFFSANAEEGSYFCSVNNFNDILSLPLCLGSACWSVTYTDKRVCALEGSSLEIFGSYLHPSDLIVNKVFWHVNPSKGFNDLRKETQFINRVEYVNQNRNSTLKMTNLTKQDSGEYRLRFLTIIREGFSGKPGVILSVTGLQVRISHSAVASEGQTTVTLSCMTSCTLSNNPIYMWYKNGQPVTNKLKKHNKLYLISTEDSGNYSCAVRGHEDLRSPEQTVTIFPGKAKLWKYGALAAAVLVPVLLLSLLTAIRCIKRKRGAERDTSVQNDQGPVSHIYTALNPATMSSNYDTLVHVRDSASNTYINIDPTSMFSSFGKLKK